MSEILFLIFIAASSLTFLLLLYLGFMFYNEGEKTAAQKALMLSLIVLIAGLVIYIFQLAIVVYILVTIAIAFVVLCFIPFPLDQEYTDSIPTGKHDERDIMFSRKKLIPDTEKYKAYYKKHPEKELLDNAFRKEPGLLSPKSTYYNKKAFEAADAYFEEIGTLHPYIEGASNPEKTKLDAKTFTERIKKQTLDLGALDVGITNTKPYHFYSHKGRGDEYGNIIDNSHQIAIAFTVEMNHEMVMAAPQASIVMESAKQYLNAGKIATQIAELIRDMGYDARAHIDGNYQLICPLVARDAGLGEIGRMGLLMTDTHGPRVRIAVVTTDMELLPDAYTKQHSVIDFCRMCKKCADCCPSQSIQKGDPTKVNGVKRWKIDSESCFTFWCKAGTDCGRCMAVCPYSHPDHSLHNFIRWGINRSKFIRYMAVHLDDYFYGKRPAPKPLPKDLL